MIVHPKLRTLAILATGAVCGIAAMWTYLNIDHLKAFVTPARWQYSELSGVRVEGCRITGLPEEVAVHMASVDKGDLIPEFEVGERVRHDTRMVDVLVSRQDRPVMLVLAARRSIIWNVSIVKGVRLAAVLVIGTEPQGLIGIPRAIPHLTLSESQRSDDCPRIRGRYVHSTSSDAFDQMEAIVQAITGRTIFATQSERAAARLVVGPRRQFSPESLMHTDEMEADYPAVGSVMPDGKDGLDWLEANGLIRQASIEEVDAWIAGVGPTDGLPIEFQRLKVNRWPAYVFVALDQIEIPYGLDGNYSFILPDGVADPGNAGAISIYRMSDFSCSPADTCFH